LIKSEVIFSTPYIPFGSEGRESSFSIATFIMSAMMTMKNKQSRKMTILESHFKVFNDILVQYIVNGTLHNKEIMFS
jgi:hypothetical protein